MKIILVYQFIFFFLTLNTLYSAHLAVEIDAGFDMQNAQYLSITKALPLYEFGSNQDTLKIIPITSNTFCIDFDLPDTPAEYRISFAPIDYGESFFIKNSDTIHYFLNYNKEFFISLTKDYGYTYKLIESGDSLNNFKLSNFMRNTDESMAISSIKSEILLIDNTFMESISEKLKQKIDSALICQFIKTKLTKANQIIITKKYLKLYRDKSIKISTNNPFLEICNILQIDNDSNISGIHSEDYIRDLFTILKIYYKREIDSNFSNSLSDNKTLIDKLVPAKIRPSFYKQFLLSYLLNSESDIKLLQYLSDFIETNQKDIPKNISNYFVNQIEKKIRFKAGMTFPNISVQSIEEKFIDLKNEFKRPTIIYIWATWCVHCIEVFKKISKIKSILDKNNIDLILLSTDPGFSRWNKYVSTHLKDYRNFISLGGSESPIGRLFGINSIPFYIFVDSDGKILKVNNFSFGDENFENNIKEMLSKKIK